MSAYEQRAREWLESWFSFGQAPNDRVVEGLIAFAGSIAAEARGQAIEECWQVCDDVANDPEDSSPAGRALECRDRIRSISPHPSVRLVARSDLAHALGTCGCVYSKCDHGGRLYGSEHRAAIDRLRAGEEGIIADGMGVPYGAGFERRASSLAALLTRTRAEGAAEALRNAAAAFNGDETWTEIEVRDWLLAAAGPDRAAVARKGG